MATVDPIRSRTASQPNTVRVLRIDPTVPLRQQLEDVEVDLVDEVHLDFSQLETINSMQLSELIRFSVRLRTLDKSVVARDMTPVVAEIFSITQYGSWSIR